MVKAVKGLFGGETRQDKLLKQQQRELKAVEAGQQRLTQGGRGLLAFIDDDQSGGKNLGGIGAGGLLGLMTRAVLQGGTAQGVFKRIREGVS